MGAISAEAAKELEQLWALKQSGALSADEYQRLKDDILGSTQTPASNEREPAPEVQPDVESIALPVGKENHRPDFNETVADRQTSTSRVSASTFIGWTWMGFTGLMVLGALAGREFATASLLLVSGLLVLPPLWRLERVASLPIPATVRFIGAAFAFIVAVLIPSPDRAAPASIPTPVSGPANAPETVTPTPTNYSMALQASPLSGRSVQFEVTTNLPLPVEVMAVLTLAGLRDDETWVGYQQKVVLDKPTTTFTLDASSSDKPFPSGTYDAEVSFYPRWGAERNEAAKSAPKLSATRKVTLRGSGISADSARLMNERQRWVMGEVSIHDRWDEAAFVARLGNFEKQPATLSHLHDAYYFPGADMTIIVNRLLNEVSIWRVGRATK